MRYAKFFQLKGPCSAHTICTSKCASKVSEDGVTGAEEFINHRSKPPALAPTPPCSAMQPTLISAFIPVHISTAVLNVA